MAGFKSGSLQSRVLGYWIAKFTRGHLYELLVNYVWKQPFLEQMFREVPKKNICLDQIGRENFKLLF